MAIQTSERLSFQQAEALLYMMGVNDKSSLYTALDRPDRDIKARGQVWVRYFYSDNNFTVTFR